MVNKYAGKWTTKGPILKIQYLVCWEAASSTCIFT